MAASNLRHLITVFLDSHPSECHRMESILQELSRFKDDELTSISYDGCTYATTPEGRHSHDCDAKYCLTLFLNWLNMFPQILWTVYEWAQLPYQLNVDSKTTATAAYRSDPRPKLREEVLILPSKPFSLNVSDGGALCSKVDPTRLDMSIQEVMDHVRILHSIWLSFFQRLLFPNQVKTNTEPRRAFTITGDAISSIRTRLTNLFRAYDPKFFRVTPPHVSDEVLAGATAIGMNEHGLVVNASILEETTNEEVLGRSHWTGRDRGAASRFVQDLHLKTSCSHSGPPIACSTIRF